MSNTWVNIRFLFWHLQIEVGKYMPSISFNKDRWNKWFVETLLMPFEIHDFNWSERK